MSKRSCLSHERLIYSLVPPTGVTKLHHIALGRVELAENVAQSRLCKTVTRRELEQKAAHPITEDIGISSQTFTV